ncbi:protein kinase [Mycobacterium lentiflavum]|uniref:non-specific serine/threonine protein kinase n=2 Tax=Mycobacterium lentiflavum TaxID=141349 RepID=A0ABY3V5Z2_MYCLN|nr:protein kinase [Mycobacterium lentiflavum]ULP45019.2 protein kinase [Mycobacterium lentiflavum]
MSTEVFGHYELQGLLGRGGMGQVFRAHDTRTDRVVALKVLPAHLADDEEFQQRFRREARIAASLNDPHMVPIHSYGEIDGRLYVDMRLVEGRDLLAYIAENGGRLSPERAVAVVEQVAAALDTAHEVGLIHRDIKPSNILVSTRDFVYLIDFGLARTAADTALTHTGHTMGTMAYMAPERFRGITDHRADVYALACVLYECLTGHLPYPGDTFEEQLNAHLNTPPPRPSAASTDVSQALDAVVARGMAKDVDRRFQTAIELAQAARAALSSPSSTAAWSAPPAQPPASQPPAPRPESGASQQPKPANSRRLILGIVGGSVVVLAAVITLVVVLVTHHNSGSSTATTSTTMRIPVHTKEPRPGIGPGAPVPALPAFAPPPDLGANCQYPAAQEASVKPVNPPPSGKISTEPPVIRATITTNVGDIGIALDNAKAPCTVNSFVSLARQQFFDGTQCGKLIIQSDFGILQCGGPDTEGTGGPGYEFANEYPANQYSAGDPAYKQPVLYPRGALTTAPFDGPNPSGSQFNLTYKDSVSDPNCTVFGTIDQAGLATIDKIVKAGVLGNGDDGLPSSPVTITSVRIG